jgi:tetratricopeptide (TPR) repeat protein
MRASRALAVMLAACVLPAAAGASQSDHWDAARKWLERSELSRDQQRTVERKLKQIERNRNKERDKRRKEALKKSKAAIKEAYEKGKKAFEEKRYSTAYLYFEEVAACSLKEAASMVSDARSKVLEIEAMALAKVEEAELLLYRNDTVGAAERLQEAALEFPHCEAARKARSRLQGLKSLPAVAAALRYAEGKAQEDAENYYEALKAYDAAARRWPEELPGLRARFAAQKIRSDPEKMEWVREALEAEAERECPTLLNLAKNYLANGNVKRATDKLDRVVADFPGTSYAELAGIVKGHLAEGQVAPALEALRSGTRSLRRPTGSLEAAPEEASD